MPSKEVLAYDRWPTILLYHKIDISKIFFKAQNDSLRVLLWNNIYIERRNGYSLRGGGCLSVPRFNKTHEGFVGLQRHRSVEYDLPQ